MCVRESLAMNVDWQRRADAAHKIWYIRGDDIEAVTKYSGKTIEQIQKLPFKVRLTHELTSEKNVLFGFYF